MKDNYPPSQSEDWDIIKYCLRHAIEHNNGNGSSVRVMTDKEWHRAREILSWIRKQRREGNL